MSFISKLFVSNPLKEAKKVVEHVNSLESKFESFSQEDLQALTKKWQNEISKLENSEQIDNYLSQILPEAFAVVRESAKRTLGQRHYDVQIIGGFVLNQKTVAEMKTGEGKTLASTLPIYLNALSGKGVHVVTVNDYLARRDASWMGQIFHYLGLTVGTIQHEQSFLYSETDQLDTDITPDESEGVQIDVKNLIKTTRREAYAADITYGTNNEFGFDYLRDNMAQDKNQLAQRDLNYAIVDEVDSILIDEARTPLIISAPDVESTKMYQEFSDLISTFSDEDFVIDEKHKQATFSDAGYQKLEDKLGVEIYSDIKLRHHANAALRARTLFHKDRDYVIKDGEIVIVDEFTGRLTPGRRYSEGLHQAIEAKEGVAVKQESKTLATITFQNYFRLYNKLAGMTGTAETEAEEFYKIYGLEVAVIPTNKPVARKDLSDSIYKTEAGKYEAIVREIKQRQENNQPVLIGTVSIEKNEQLSKYLKKAGVKHEILNAKNNEKEAQIIAQAGGPGVVTIATNIAGRGVDIILGGNPFDENKAQIVKEAGGLHVIGTERHESRRIDNQLRGRSGRQGDPGSSQFFLSLEDSLMQLFGGDRLKNMMTTLKIPEDQPIENRLISRSIESAQSKIEGMNFDVRKHVLEFDDVLNKQREVIYRKRKDILFGNSGLSDQIQANVESEIYYIVNSITANPEIENKDSEILKQVNAIFPVTKPNTEKIDENLWIKHLTSEASKLYKQKIEEIGAQMFQQIEKMIMLQTIDKYWMEHLDTMDHLRQSVRLRGYAQKDPLVEYKKDGKRLFEDMLDQIDRSIVYTIYKVQMKPKTETSPNLMPNQNTSSTFAQKINNNPESNKVGRNDPCPCGSGKKYKKCHGK